MSSQVNGVTVVGMNDSNSFNANPSLFRHSGFVSSINNGTFGSTNSDGVACYNFLSTGNAPSVFQSEVRVGSSDLADSSAHAAVTIKTNGRVIADDIFISSGFQSPIGAYSFSSSSDRFLSVGGHITSNFGIYGLRFLPNSLKNSDEDHSTQGVVGIESNYVNLDEAPNANRIDCFLAAGYKPTAELPLLQRFTGFTINVSDHTSDTINPDADVYSIRSTGNAPTFHKGDIHIGGSGTRNTRELWESTLTEEQQEQLTAGTLDIPANVSTPGDGSFVRQWWYDQQDTETQALIDSGDIDYPEPYRVANFVDTFDLGVTSAINLLSNGTMYGPTYRFNATGETSIGTPNADTGTKLVLRGFTEGAGNGYGINNQVSLQSSNVNSSYYYNAESQSSSSEVFTTTELAGYRYVQGGFNGNTTVTRSYGFIVANSMSIGSQNNYAFYCQNTNSGNNYNFYAQGDAPNYYQGDVFVGGSPGDPVVNLRSTGNSYFKNKVGIGTGTPEKSLHVVTGDSQAAAFYSKLPDTIGSEDAGQLFTLHNNQGKAGLTFASGDTRLVAFAANDREEVGMRCHKMFLRGADYISFKTGNLGTGAMKITADGKVGIGLENPADKLHVNGNVRATNFNGPNGGALTFGVPNVDTNRYNSNGMVVYAEGSSPIPDGQLQLLSTGPITANGSPVSTAFIVNDTETESDITNASAIIEALQPKILSGGGSARLGFNVGSLLSNVAESVTTYTHVITTPDDETPQTEERTSYDATRLIPVLTKALQEALTEINSLKTRLDVLEGN